MTEADKPDDVASPPKEAADDDLAPRPRPGWRSRDRTAGAEKAYLFAGVMRAGAGAAGLFASLLYLPIQNVTPVLAGVSILMMVTGCTSSWRSVADVPALKKIPRIVVASCAGVTALTLLLTVVLGAGSLGPIADVKHKHAHDRGADGTVSFQPAP